MKNEKNLALLALLGDEHSGRDEMNLAGNPFALLQASSKSGQSFIKNEWERRLANGRLVMASWEVNGHAELGLPGPSEELLYLVLLKLTREAAGEGEWPQKVFFSRHKILQDLRWSDKGPSYALLNDAFARLQSVSIHAKHSFWDARTGAPFASIGFGLLNEYAIASEPRGLKEQGHLPLSWFEWNTIIYNSFLAGNVRSLALDFALSLEHPTTRRLFRCLDMMRRATKPPRKEFTIGLLKLRDRLGMTSYQYASKIKQVLAPAIAELCGVGYLEKVCFEKSKPTGEQMAIFTFGSLSAPTSEPTNERVETDAIPVLPTSTQSRASAKNLNRTQNANPTAASESTLEFAHRMAKLFRGLSASEQSALREQARAQTEAAFWDRLEIPDSPISLVLWQLVKNHIAQ